ncbi:uncharacterized protein LOC129585860 [Paramacrobiotus metropolitanus]|uniref:uncharacterized protein LOC129585860 n=1 Tax=Paramacrobiotus metropolitanus TaxID=2943436 RepID=UPI002445E9AD|nr:uncharacterized protein LOC129585860 [Paramacrobiotus metropolitanus]
MYGNFSRIFYLILAFECFSAVNCTTRYYNSYTTYGSGDTVIFNYHIHGGPRIPNRKWNCECLDGEAMIGIADYYDDFSRLQQTWCKFTYQYKPPAQGKYPYYGGCHVRNYTDQYFCFDPRNAEKTFNTFITAMWSNSYFWYINNVLVTELNQQQYKCCQPPNGYYVDYTSCYYVSTHDFQFEYYDNYDHFIVFCTTGYVMTGISKKINPYNFDYHIDWIQCCRMGYGAPEAHSPPVIYSPSGASSYYSYPSGRSLPDMGYPPPPAYKAQYLRKQTVNISSTLLLESHINNPRDFGVQPTIYKGSFVDAE